MNKRGGLGLARKGEYWYPSHGFTFFCIQESSRGEATSSRLHSLRLADRWLPSMHPFGILRGGEHVYIYTFAHGGRMGD